MNKELEIDLGFSLPEHDNNDDAWADIERRLMTGEDFDDLWEAVKQLRSETETAEELSRDREDAVESCPAPGLEGVCFHEIPGLEGVRFYKIPRSSTKPKEGNVGNVLGKDFMKYMKDGTMLPTGVCIRFAVYIIFGAVGLYGHGGGRPTPMAIPFTNESPIKNPTPTL